MFVSGRFGDLHSCNVTSTVINNPTTSYASLFSGESPSMHVTTPSTDWSVYYPQTPLSVVPQTPMMVATTKPLRIPGLKYLEPETPLGMSQFVGPVPPTPQYLPRTPPEVKQVKVFSPHTPPELLAAARNVKSIPLSKTPPTPPRVKPRFGVVEDGTTMP